MEIWQLRCFIALADTLSFSRAAESLYLSQSALSRRISDLEKELGLPLFTRNTRRVELTEPGRTLQIAAKDIISRWEKVIPSLQESTYDPKSQITLSVGYDPRSLSEPSRHRRVMDAVFDLRCQYPGIRLLFQKMGYRDLVQSLLDHSLDCALVLDRQMEHRAELESVVLFREKMALVFRSGEKCAPEQFRDILMSRGLIVVDKEIQGLHHIIRILSDLRLEPQIRFCETFDDMTLTVESGESAAILPESVVAHLQNPALQAIPLPSEYADLEMSILWEKRQTNAFLPKFVDMISRILSSGENVAPEGE